MTINQLEFSKFPTTRYQGSKRKILPWLFSAFQNLDFETVLDACGGTGSVSYLLKRMGKSVIYNDKLKFNFLIGRAIIENRNEILSDDDLAFLLRKNSEIEYQSFIQTRFKEIYYLDHENAWLDQVVLNIQNFRNYKNPTLKNKQALAYYALFQSCLVKRPFNLFHRKNLEIRTSDVKRSFGNKITWDKPFEEHYIRFANEANDLIFDSGKNCIATNRSVLQIDPYGIDLIYLDPPYIRKDSTNESSDYLKCYHFLEGLSNYTKWHEMIDFTTPNLRMRNPYNADEFSEYQIFETIEEILHKFRKSIIVLSYKKGGTPSIDTLRKMMKKFKKEVYTTSMHYKYALNNQNGNALKNREVLIIGK